MPRRAVGWVRPDRYRLGMRRIAILSPLFVVAACHWPRQQPVTPQRPTVSVDTSTTAVGTVEVEAGVNVDPGEAFDSPTTIKFGTGERTEWFVGYSPFVHLDQPGRDADGGGDLVVGTRTRIVDAADGRPSAALVLSGKLPTASASSGIGTGELDLRVGGVLNQQFGAVTANAFYQYGALGAPSGGTSSEHTATLTGSWSLAERWGGFAELAGVFVPSTRTDSVFTILGVTYAPEPWVVFDGGVTVGLSDDAPDLQLFFGCTHNFGAAF